MGKLFTVRNYADNAVIGSGLSAYDISLIDKTDLYSVVVERSGYVVDRLCQRHIANSYESLGYSVTKEIRGITYYVTDYKAGEPISHDFIAKIRKECLKRNDKAPISRFNDGLNYSAIYSSCTMESFITKERKKAKRTNKIKPLKLTGSSYKDVLAQVPTGLPEAQRKQVARRYLKSIGR